jgi:hypothetical protein
MPSFPALIVGNNNTTIISINQLRETNLGRRGDKKKLIVLV